MASITTKFFLLFMVLITNSFILLNATAFSPWGRHNLLSCNFDKIYQLGDSISDSGNLIREPTGSYTPFAKLPYGETYFKEATGRCSNGLLMIDFIAWAAGVPLLNPYKNSEAYFENGVNFAVAGATALPVQTLREKNIIAPVTNSSLDVQLGWLSTHLASICKTDADCTEKLKNSLFMVGEVGGNDYNYALGQGKTIDEVKATVPDVVQAIINATRRVIHLGAPRVIVPGNFPIGCLPIYLTNFKQNNSAAYDDLRCLKELNNFATYHNDHLQEAIQKLKKELGHKATIVYADYYNSFTWILEHASYLGFDVTSVQKSCCGAGGEYNFNFTRMCGGPNVPVCSNPDLNISWDGIHLTQKAYEIMANWLISRNISPNIKC